MVGWGWLCGWYRVRVGKGAFMLLFWLHIISLRWLYVCNVYILCYWFLRRAWCFLIVVPIEMVIC